MGLGKCLASRPGSEILHRPPPGLDLVIALGVGILDKSPGLMVKSNRARTVDLVANKTGSAVDKVNPVSEAVLEVDFMARGNGYAVGDNNHRDPFNSMPPAFHCRA